jgi:hypothetical protein
MSNEGSCVNRMKWAGKFLLGELMREMINLRVFLWLVEVMEEDLGGSYD